MAGGRIETLRAEVDVEHFPPRDAVAALRDDSDVGRQSVVPSDGNRERLQVFRTQIERIGRYEQDLRKFHPEGVPAANPLCARDGFLSVASDDELPRA